jgi:hypothetical protein
MEFGKGIGVTAPWAEKPLVQPRQKKTTPSLDEWTAAVGRPGLEGGCDAFTVDIDEIEQQEDVPILCSA